MGGKQLICCKRIFAELAIISKAMNSTYRNKKAQTNRGIAIYLAVVVTAALVLVSFAVISLAIKEVGTSGAAKDSQGAFYAADSGVECALYWDLKNPSGNSAFATSTGSIINCNADAANLVTNGAISVGGGGNANPTSIFNLTFLPDTYCVNVTVVKSYSGGSPKTKIESRGYNSCSTTNARRVERAIVVNY